MKPASYLIACIIVICLPSPTVHAQDVKLVELLGSACRDSTCFTDFITKHGYKYVESSVGKESKHIRFRSTPTFVSTSTPSLPKLPDFIAFTSRNSKVIEITYGTAKRENYDRLTNELEANGYKFYKVDELENNISWTFFRSSLFPRILLCTTFDVKPNPGDPCVIYQVRLMKLP